MRRFRTRRFAAIDITVRRMGTVAPNKARRGLGRKAYKSRFARLDAGGYEYRKDDYINMMINGLKVAEGEKYGPKATM